MPSVWKKYHSNFLKEETTAKFADFYKQVLLAPRLSAGCRRFLFSLATIPFTSEYSDRKLGRKLGVDGKAIRRWRKEAVSASVEVCFRSLY